MPLAQSISLIISIASLFNPSPLSLVPGLARDESGTVDVDATASSESEAEMDDADAHVPSTLRQQPRRTAARVAMQKCDDMRALTGA